MHPGWPIASRVRRCFELGKPFDTTTVKDRFELEIIRSTQNPAIRRLVRLRKSRRRKREGVFLVDGVRESLRAVERGYRIAGLYEQVDPAGHPVVPGNALQWAAATDTLRSAAIAAGVYFPVAAEPFAKICYGEATTRCVCEFESISDAIVDLAPVGPGLILVLDRVEKPGNVGAIFRTADAAGVSAVLMCDCPSDRFNSNAIRGSLGAVFTVASAAGTLDEVQSYLSQNVDRVLAMRVEGAKSLYKIDWAEDPRRSRVAVIVGNEAEGLHDRWRTWGRGGREVEGVFLPMLGSVDSLNVSVSAAVMAFEFLRQSRGKRM